MRRKTYSGMACPIAQTLDVVGDPWTLLIVRDALSGITRFADFQARLEIPRNTLTDRLKLLTDHGILDRRRYQDHPPRYDYHLTSKGRDLRTVIVGLLQWGDQYAGFDEPPVVLVDGHTGQQLDPLLIDRNTGRPLNELNPKPIVTRAGRPDRTDDP